MAYAGYINPDVAKMYGIPYSQLTAEQKKILHEDSLRRAKLINERQQEVMKNGLKAFDDEAKMERVLASLYRDCQKQILADVTETISKVQKAGGVWSYANQSALTRSRGLFEQITQELTKLGQKETGVFYKGLENIYTDQYLRQMFTLGQFTEVKANLNRLNPALIRKTLDYPWSGAMFSDRIWNDKEKLGRNLRLGLTQSMILGEGIPAITERVRKNIETSKYNAERVARTETKRVTYCAHNDIYEDIGIDELEYRCANGGDSRTCDLCRDDNGKHFKRGEEPTLPRHPNCRCVYIPVVADTFKPGELNDLTGSIRGAENYEKWMQENADKLNPDGSLKDGWVRDWENGGKLVYKGDPEALKIPEKNAKDMIQENVDKIIAENDGKRRDIQMQIDTKNEEYKNIPAKYQAQRDELEAKRAEAEAKMNEAKLKKEALEAEKAALAKQRSALFDEWNDQKISDEEYEKRKAVIRAERRRLDSLISGLDYEYASCYTDIEDIKTKIQQIPKLISDDRYKIMAEIRGLDDEIKLLYSLEQDLHLDIEFVGDSIERYDHIQDFRAIRENLRANTTFDFDLYSAELAQMAQRMDSDALTVQRAIAVITKDNQYGNPRAGWYSSFKRRVEMDMSDNTHERALGNGLKGAWQTKYHEEGHQLDHLLSKVEAVAGDKDGFQRAFTDPHTPTGQRIQAALEDDLLGFVNQAVTYYNGVHGKDAGFKAVKAVSSFDRIPREVRYAFDEYYCSITNSGMDRAEACRMGILSDAIGLFTKDKLSRNTLSCGGWGHDSAYNKDRGKAGSASGTWATFCALRTAGSKAEVSRAKELMPKTWGVMDGIFHDIAEYSKNNVISY